MKIQKNKLSFIKLGIIVSITLFLISSFSITKIFAYNLLSNSGNNITTIPNNLTNNNINDNNASNNNDNLNNINNNLDNSNNNLNNSNTNNLNNNSNLNTNNNLNNNKNSNNKDTKAISIELCNTNEYNNIPFSIENMFPGDTYTNYYCVNVSYKNKVTVNFNVDVDNKEYEKLLEVLKIKVKLLNNDSVLYDGLIKDIPSSLSYILSSNNSTSTNIYYEITTYLDTSVNNDYQDKTLVVDFNWYVEEVKNLEPSKDNNILKKVVNTGVNINNLSKDNQTIYFIFSLLLMLISLSSFIYLLFILDKYRKDNNRC